MRALFIHPNHRRCQVSNGHAATKFLGRSSLWSEWLGDSYDTRKHLVRFEDFAMNMGVAQLPMHKVNIIIIMHACGGHRKN